MHPLKGQRKGVKYGRGVKYSVTPVSLQKSYSTDILHKRQTDLVKSKLAIMSKQCVYVKVENEEMSLHLKNFFVIFHSAFLKPSFFYWFQIGCCVAVLLKPLYLSHFRKHDQKIPMAPQKVLQAFEKPFS